MVADHLNAQRDDRVHAVAPASNKLRGWLEETPSLVELIEMRSNGKLAGAPAWTTAKEVVRGDAVHAVLPVAAGDTVLGGLPNAAMGTGLQIGSEPAGRAADTTGAVLTKCAALTCVSVIVVENGGTHQRDRAEVGDAGDGRASVAAVGAAAAVTGIPGVAAIAGCPGVTRAAWRKGVAATTPVAAVAGRAAPAAIAAITAIGNRSMNQAVLESERPGIEDARHGIAGIATRRASAAVATEAAFASVTTVYAVVAAAAASAAPTDVAVAAIATRAAVAAGGADRVEFDMIERERPVVLDAGEGTLAGDRRATIAAAAAISGVAAITAAAARTLRAVCSRGALVAVPPSLALPPIPPPEIMRCDKVTAAPGAMTMPPPMTSTALNSPSPPDKPLIVISSVIVSWLDRLTMLTCEKVITSPS